MTNKDRKDLIRFLEKIEVDHNGCWNWTSALNGPTGAYSQFSLNCKTVRGHRFSYERFIGKIPKGLTINHECKNTICVNPRHLKPMTLSKNLLLGNTVCGINSRKTNCHKGHPFSGKNLRKYKNKRICRTCLRDWGRNYYPKKRMELKYAQTKIK